MLNKGARIAVVARGRRVDPQKLVVPVSRLHEWGWWDSLVAYTVAAG
jgi:hypothetical protein